MMHGFGHDSVMCVCIGAEVNNENGLLQTSDNYKWCKTARGTAQWMSLNPLRALPEGAP